MATDTKKDIKPADGFDKIIQLTEAVTFGNDQRTYINLRKPKCKNLRQLPMDMENMPMHLVNGPTM